MNATEQKALLAILHDGDLLAALDYVEGACKPSKPKATGPAPIPLKKLKASRFLPPRVALGVAPCGCTLYQDTARQCEACIAARSPDACRALIAQHEPALAAFDQSQGVGFRGHGAGRSYRSPRSRDFMIHPHNGYYGQRDKVEVA